MTPQQHDRHRDGISIEDRWKARGRRQGKRWLAKVRDTRLQRYKRKAFSDLVVAKDWARVTRARLELAETSAGTWPLADVITDCAAFMVKEGRNPAYIKAVQRHGGMLQRVGVRDLADEALQGKVRLYLELPTDEAHRRHQSSEAPAASTIQVRFIYVRVLVTYAMRHMGLRNDPLAGFVMPRNARREAVTRTSDQETYTLAEVRAVLALDRREDPVWVAFVVAIFTGLRAFELHALRWEAIDWAARMLRVARGKGAKVRHVPLPNQLHDFLRGLGGPDAKSPRLGPIVSSTLPRLNVEYLRPLLTLAGVEWERGDNELSGLPRRLTWHACRRTCAAASLAAGVDSLEIQRSLGHEEMEMTGEYAGAFTRWKAAVQAEGWPRGHLCFFLPDSHCTGRVENPTH
jgi:integrase